jgi:hypothetical protein
MSGESSPFPAPTLPPPSAVAPVAAPALPSLPSLATPTAAAPFSAAPSSVAQPTFSMPPTASLGPATPNWKPIKSSKPRKVVNGIIGLAVVGGLGVGAYFLYQNVAPSTAATTPTTLLKDNRETMVGQAYAVMNKINDNSSENEGLDMLGLPHPTAPTTVVVPDTTTP